MVRFQQFEILVGLSKLFLSTFMRKNEKIFDNRNLAPDGLHIERKILHPPNAKRKDLEKSEKEKQHLSIRLSEIRRYLLIIKWYILYLLGHINWAYIRDRPIYHAVLRTGILLANAFAWARYDNPLPIPFFSSKSSILSMTQPYQLYVRFCERNIIRRTRTTYTQSVNFFPSNFRPSNWPSV